MSAENPNHPAPCKCSMCSYLKEMGQIAADQHEERWAWIAAQVQKQSGIVSFGVTEDGNVGVFFAEEPMSRGTGDSPEEAVDSAIRREIREACGLDSPAASTPSEG